MEYEFLDEQTLHAPDLRYIEEKTQRNEEKREEWRSFKKKEFIFLITREKIFPDSHTERRESTNHTGAAGRIRRSGQKMPLLVLEVSFPYDLENGTNLKERKVRRKFKDRGATFWHQSWEEK